MKLATMAAHRYLDAEVDRLAIEVSVLLDRLAAGEDVAGELADHVELLNDAARELGLVERALGL